MTTVSSCAADSGWYLDVLKDAFARGSHKRVEEMFGESDGTALEEMLNEEQVTPLVCVAIKNKQQKLYTRYLASYT